MGKYIAEIDDLYRGLTGLFTEGLNLNPPIKQAILDTNLCLQMNYKDPEGLIVVDATGDEIAVYAGECRDGVAPKVKLNLAADTAHMYWLGKVNFMIAMQKGEIRSEGDLGLILKLIPVLGPMFKVYADYLKANGMETLLV